MDSGHYSAGLCMSFVPAINEFLRLGINDAEAGDTIVEDTSSAISTRKHDLVQLVAALGDYLTETDASIRSRAMRLLQRVLGSLPRNALSGQHITVMNRFFCDKLADDVCLGESLSALASISKMNLFSDDDAQKLMISVFEITDDAQKLPQRIRFQIYVLVDIFMSERRGALRKLPVFIPRYADLMAGEKDPRNLMLAFSILRIILAEFDIVSHVSVLFDATYCYFPITFRPPPDDPSSITTDDLKCRLRECLCATHQFAPFLVPALIEKLNAVALSVKKDSILTLNACCQTYSARTLDAYTSQLWASLRFEIIQSEDELLEKFVLQLMTSISRCLCKGLIDMPKSGSLSRWLQPIVTESMSQLQEPDHKTAKPCGRILHSVAIAAQVCLDVVVRSILPGLLALCQESEDNNRTTSLLEVLHQIILAALDVEDKRGATDAKSSLDFVKEEMTTLLFRALVGTNPTGLDLRNVSLNCLIDMAHIPKLLQDRDYILIIGHLNSLVLEEVDDGIRSAATRGLVRIARHRSSLVLEHTFPALLVHLPYHADEANHGASDRVLEVMSELSQEKIIFDTLIVRLLSRLDTCLQAQPLDTAYPSKLLATLLKGLQHFPTEAVNNASCFYDKIAPQLFNRTIRFLDSFLTAPEVLVITSEVINVLTRDCDIAKQREIAGDMMCLFVTGGLNSIITHMDPDFRPFDCNVTKSSQMDTVALFVASFAGFRREIGLIAKLNLGLLQKSMDSLQSASNDHQRHTLCHLVALLINKCQSNEEVTDYLQDFLKLQDCGDVKNLEVLLWITKALVLRGHKAFQNMSDRIFRFLPHAEHGATAAEGFRVLVGSDKLLTKSNHGIVKSLHKHKFYSFAVPALLQQLDSSPHGLLPES